MKLKIMTIVAMLWLLTGCASAADFSCKTLRECAVWATNRTAQPYDLGKLDKRSLKLDKDFTFSEGDADFVFNYILQNNEFVRLKNEGGGYRVIAMKEMKDFQFPNVKLEEIPPTLDFYSADFTLSSKEKVKNALSIIKKFLSKNGRTLEAADAPRIQVIDTGIQLNAIKLIINGLNK